MARQCLDYKVLDTTELAECILLSLKLGFSGHGALPNPYMLSLFQSHNIAVIGVCSFR